LRFTGTLTCQVFFRSVSFRMRNRGRVSGLQAALSGSNPKAPGFAGGYLLSKRQSRAARPTRGASLFVNFAGDEMTLLIEVAMVLGMNSGESIYQGAFGAPLAEETESSKFYEHSHA
jgi:hypothetical protein